MVFVWAVKMRVIFCLLLTTVSVLADKNGNVNRRTKPFIADAVGNTLPPPSSVPATVGSPINLLTPDKYEFYTFDESGELVKRLMTLEEIQAIVAAGEDSDGLVTFANDNQPTIAFNFSQPPYTKVHSVVTNVQNVLKAQMEAHKNKPLVQPTLDTPDVSDTWSLILPSIFGNSGGDIAPDKPASSFTPDTETVDDNYDDNNEENLSKEGGVQILSPTTEEEGVDEVKTTDINKTSQASSTTTTSTTSTTTTTTTTTAKTTTPKKIITTTTKPSTTTIRKKLVTTTRPRTTTKQPTATRKPTTTTTVKPKTTLAPKATTEKLTTTSKKHTTTTTKTTISNDIPTAKPLSELEKNTSTTKESTTTTSTTTISNDIPTAKPDKEFEKVSTYIPVSTVKYVTERTTEKSATKLGNHPSTTAPFVYAPTTKKPSTTSSRPLQAYSTTQAPKLQITLTTPELSTVKNFVTTATQDIEHEKINITTITTQTVSPSTTVSPTEFVLLDQSKPNFTDNDMKDDDSILPLFDVAQSISQIASDLGNNYQPIPTTSNLHDTTKLNSVDMESKEDLEMDIPIFDSNNNKDKNEDNFVKISTIDPHPQVENKIPTKEVSSNINVIKITTLPSTTTENIELTTSSSFSPDVSTMDPFLSESMGDLLSQVVHEAPQTILNSGESNPDIENKKLPTTEKPSDTITDFPLKISSSDSLLSTTQQSFMDIKQNQVNQTKPSDETKKHNSDINTTTSANNDKITTEKERENITTEKNILVQSTDNNDLSVSQLVVTTDKSVVTQDTIKEETPIKSSSESNVITTVTTENIISSTKEPTETVSFVNDNITTSKDNETEKDENSNNFVQISISGAKNISDTEFKNYTDNNVNIIEKNESSNKITTPVKQVTPNVIKNNIINVQNSTNQPFSEKITTPKTDATTSINKFNTNKNKTVSSSQSNNINKQSVENKTKLNNVKDKTSELLPKVDDFKKKIQKINDEVLANDRNDPWKLIPTVTPPKGNDISNDKLKPDFTFNPSSGENKDVVLEFSKENQGLEVTTKDLGEDIAQFTELCNELAFRYWNTMVENIDKKRSFVLSPYSITSMLAMMFMGARGATSGEMNEILKLDDMVTFNPHFTLKNISDSIESASNSGIVVSAFVRELFSDRNKGKILTFYKERAQHFYSGHVEEINFKLIGDIIRRRTNLLVKKHTWGKIPEYMKTNSIVMKPPLAAFSTNIFQTDCTGTSVDGRDGEMYFVVSPNVRQRRLVPVPAAVYKSGFLAGYDPVIDATAAALGNTNSIVSTIFLMPGQQGNIVHADDLLKLEQRLLEANPTTPVWNRILRTLLPRVGLELQIPRFSHKSVFNVSSTLREMGLKDLFDPDHADLGGLNGPSKDLYLSDMIQMTSFVTCGEGMIGDQHHIEDYPETLIVARRRTSRWADWDEPRDYQRAFHDPHDVGEAMHLPLHLRPRQARVPTRSVQPARLKFDRPFLFFVRHNPSGMILYVGRYNPRLLP